MTNVLKPGAFVTYTTATGLDELAHVVELRSDNRVHLRMHIPASQDVDRDQVPFGTGPNTWRFRKGES